MPLLLSTKSSGLAAATITYTDTDANSADQATYTFSGKSLGTAASNRTILVTVGFQGPNSTVVSSLTIGGTGATLVVANGTSYGGAMTGTEIWMLDLASGTSADIVVNFNATANDCTIGVFDAKGIASSAHDTDTSSAGPPSAAITIPAKGIALASVYDNNGATTATWTNLTERLDTNAAGNLHTAAADAFAAGSTPTVTCTPSAYFAPRMAICSFAAG